jgi:hypothetical protein
MLRTWLPMFGYCASADRLSDKLLKRQIVDARTILEMLDALATDTVPFPYTSSNDMVLLGWRGHERSLCIYFSSFAHEWRVKRKLPGGFVSAAWASKRDEELAGLGPPHNNLNKPPWVGNEDVCRSHRSRLIALNEKRYRPLWPSCPRNMPTLWPQLTNSDPRGYRLRLAPGGPGELHQGELVLPNWLYFDKNKQEVLDERDGE